MATTKKNTSVSTTSDPAGPLDPSFKQEIRQIERGLTDKRQDTKRALKKGRRDFRRSKKRTRADARRQRQQVGRELERGLLGIENQRHDLTTEFTRGIQDLNQAINRLQMEYGRLSHHQMQQMNAAGLLGGGAEAAAAAARAFNHRLDLEPIETSRRRATEDYRTGMERFDTQADWMTQDAARARGDIGRTTRREIGDMRRAHKDFRFDTKQAESRAHREGRIRQTDLNELATFDAQERRKMMGY